MSDRFSIINYRGVPNLGCKLPRGFFGDFIGGRPSTSRPRLTVAAIFFPKVKGHILFNAKSKYELIPIVPTSKTVTLSLVLPGGIFPDYTKETIYETLCTYDVIPAYCLEKSDDSIVYKQAMAEMKLKAPLFYITFKVPTKMNFYMEDNTTPPREFLDYAETVTNPAIVAHYIFGNHIFLLTNFKEHAKDVTVKVMNFDTNELVDIDNIAKEENYTQVVSVVQYRKLFDKCVKSVTRFQTK